MGAAPSRAAISAFRCSRSADGLPYIGRDIRGAWIATGFGTDGLTWGTVSAHLIADSIAGRNVPFADLCKPGRFNPVKPHRHRRTLRRHLPLLDFLLHAVISHRAWLR